MNESESTNVDTKSEVDLSGQRLGDYQLLRRLGRGGMADVYLAEQQSLRRQVAFKVLKRHLASDESYVRRFANEAQSAASLVHGNIVQIHEVGCIDGIHFIAQEYVKGQNLRQYIERQGSLDAAMGANIVRQVTAALHKAGQQGIIHRDIKPENIMLSAGGEVKVADFGLARAVDGDVNLTQVGMTMGTPLYMSPEQIEGKPVDRRSDLYSFGVTSYHMLAGRPPFDGDTPLSVAVQHLEKEPDRLEDLRPDLPIGLCCVVHKMMAKKAEDRFQNALDVLRDLRTLPIEGIKGDWPSGMEHFDSAELTTLAGAKLEATQRLDTVMKTEALQIRRQRALWPLVALSIVCAFVLGSFVAWATAPRPQLQRPSKEVTVPKQKSVQEQYRYASWAQTEESWHSVTRYFPVKGELSSGERSQRLLYSRLAKQRLAEYYLQTGNYDAAMEIFDEFANFEATAVKFRAFGIAGQAVVYWNRGEEKLMRQKLDEVYNHRNSLSQYMRQMIEQLKQPRM